MLTDTPPVLWTGAIQLLLARDARKAGEEEIETSGGTSPDSKSVEIDVSDPASKRVAQADLKYAD